MPWTPADAIRHTHKAKGKKRSRQWSHVANSELQRGASEASAISAANAVAGRAKRKGDAMESFGTVRGKGRRRGPGKRR